MNGLEPPPDGDRDRGPILIAVYWTALALARFIVSLRLYARHRIRAIGPDDLAMLLSVALLAVLTVLGTVLCLRGGCRHLYFLLLEANGTGYLRVTRTRHFAEPFSFMALAAGRISVALLILRIITTSIWRRRILYALIVISLVSNVVWCTLWFAKCPPYPGISPLYQGGSCWNPDIMFGISIFTAVWNVFMDYALVLLPITVFWKLQLSPKKKITVCLLMSWGIFAAVSGTIKTAKLNGINDADFTWDEFDLYLWSAIENVLIIICGSIPTLKPIYDKFVRAGRSLKEIYLTYRRKRSTASKGSSPSTEEENSQSTNSHSIHELAQVRPNDGHGRRINGLMEVGLWSSHGTGTTTTLHKGGAEEHDQLSSGDDRSSPYGPDTSFLV